MNDFDTAFYRIVGRKLRELRTQNDYTLDFLAGKIGATIKTVQRYEVGERKIDAGKLRTMVESLGGDYDYFIAAVQSEQSGQREPTPVSESGPSEIQSIFDQLSSDNQSKLLELSRLYLTSQRKREETE